MATDPPPTGALDCVRAAYERVAARLWRSLLAWSGSADVADEAVAEAFAQLIRHRGDVRDPDAWVWRAAYRIAGGELARQRHLDDTVTDRPGVDDPSLVPLAAALVRALATLPDQQRACVVLRDVGGLDPAEVATVLGTTAGTVRVQHLRAKRRLRTLLSEKEVDTDG